MWPLLYLEVKVIGVMYSNNEVLQHASLISNGRQQALPVHQKPHLQQLFQEEGGGHALVQFEDKADDYGGDGVAEDYVSAMFVRLDTNGNLFRQQTITLLERERGEGEREEAKGQ